MKTKNQIFDTFQKLIYQIEHQFKKKFKYLYTDFGGKFINKAFEEYTAKKDIKCELYVLYISKQNGKIEHLNYTLISLI